MADSTNTIPPLPLWQPIRMLEFKRRVKLRRKYFYSIWFSSFLSQKAFFLHFVVFKQVTKSEIFFLGNDVSIRSLSQKESKAHLMTSHFLFRFIILTFQVSLKKAQKEAFFSQLLHLLKIDVKKARQMELGINS